MTNPEALPGMENAAEAVDSGPVQEAEEPVRLDIYDVAGHRVRVLVDGLQKSGLHHVEWDGADASGMPVASGVYLYRLQTGRHLQVRRMLLMK